MDVNQRYSIAYKGLKTGHHDFEFAMDGDLFRAFENADIKDGKLTAKVGMERMESQLDLQIEIDGTVCVACDRCLEDFDLPIHYEGGLIVRFSNEPAEYDGEVMWLLPAEDRVDLTQYLYESVVLSLPYSRVHPDGECNPEMLKRFNIVSQEEFDAIEQEAEKEEMQSPFKGLEALRQQMKEEEKKK